MPHPRRTSIAPWIPIAAGVSLWCAGLPADLWYDEVYRTGVFLRAESLADLLRHDVHNPLYNAFMACWIRLFTDAEWVIRLPSILAAAATLLILRRFALRHWGPRAAAWAAGWLAVAPPVVWYACEAKNTMFTILFTTAAFTALDTATRERTLRSIALAAAVGALAVWTDFQSLIVLLPAGAASLLMELRDRPGPRHSAPDHPDRGPARRAGPLLLVFALVLALTSPLLVHKLQHAADLPRAYLGFFHPGQALWLLLVYFTTGGALMPGATSLAATAALSPLFATLGALGALTLRRTRPGRIVLWCFAAALAGMYLASQLLAAFGAPFRVYQPRNLVVLLPLAALGMASWIGTTRSPWARPLGIAALCVSLASAALMRFGGAAHRDAMRPRDDFRAAAARILADAHARPVAVFSSAALLPLRYYLPDADLREGVPPQTLPPLLRDYAARHPDRTIYILRVHGEPPCPPNALPPSEPLPQRGPSPPPDLPEIFRMNSSRIEKH